MTAVLFDWHADPTTVAEGNLPDFFFMEELPSGDFRIAIRQGEPGMNQKSDPTRGLAQIIVPRLSAKALFR